MKKKLIDFNQIIMNRPRLIMYEMDSVDVETILHLAKYSYMEIDVKYKVLHVFLNEGVSMSEVFGGKADLVGITGADFVISGGTDDRLPDIKITPLDDILYDPDSSL
jgi:hypothetical protein